MQLLREQVILILSPQSWGKMFISKHHYAFELAKAGNTVCFLNPPNSDHKKRRLTIEEHQEIKNLFIVDHQLSFPYNLRFHVPQLFHYLMRRHMKQLLKNINMEVDIVWSFDLNHLYPFNIFPKTVKKIFHPVDEPLTTGSINAAKDADVILSVTEEILSKYKIYSTPKFHVKHGIASLFLEQQALTANSEIHIGISGNLLREDIDRSILLRIIQENPSIVFECWGSYNSGASNIGGISNQGTDQFINDLRSFSNVILHGAVSFQKLASEVQRMDGFLICYDVNKDQSRGTNYHKVMEYLATGKVIISNNISSYKNFPELVQMVEERNNNNALPKLFTSVISNLDQHNAEDRQHYRRLFASENTYAKQIARIDTILAALFTKTAATEGNNIVFNSIKSASVHL
jgi:hypothetical protein